MPLTPDGARRALGRGARRGLGHGSCGRRGEPARRSPPRPAGRRARLRPRGRTRAARRRASRRRSGPQAMASSVARPNGSTRLGWQTTSAAASQRGIRVVRDRADEPDARRPSSSGRSGPSPTNASVALAASRREGLGEPHDVLALDQRADAEERRPSAPAELARAQRRHPARTRRGRRRSRSPRSCRAPPARPPRARRAASPRPRRPRPHARTASRVARRTAATARVRDVLAVGGEDERAPADERREQACRHEEVRVDDVGAEAPRGARPRRGRGRDDARDRRGGRRPPARSRARGRLAPARARPRRSQLRGAAARGTSARRGGSATARVSRGVTCTTPRHISSVVPSPQST